MSIPWFFLLYNTVSISATALVGLPDGIHWPIIEALCCGGLNGVVLAANPLRRKNQSRTSIVQVALRAEGI